MENLDKGSRKHVLGWIDSANFLNEINKMLSAFSVSLADKASLYPKCHKQSKEITLPVFIRKHGQFTIKNDFQTWWAPHGGRLPMWDMISMCKINSNDGILFVEAKAHEEEFDFKEKKLKNNSSFGTKENHLNIGNRIDQAQKELTNLANKSFQISISTHYQLSNRFAWAWKLATLKVPVCLVYLGFIGDKEFPNDYFQDEDDWNKKLDNYLTGVIPKGFSGVQQDGIDFIFSRISKII
jgi:hypothetical protein